MAAERWMAGVKKGIKRRGTEGVFSGAAHRAGKSTHEFEEEQKHSSDKTGRARLALAFESASKRR